MNDRNRFGWMTFVAALALPMLLNAQTEPSKPADAAKPTKDESQEKKPEAPKAAQRQLKQLNAAPETPVPRLTPQHRLYDPLVGEWKVSVTFHGFGDQGPPAVRSRISFSSILDGRFLMENAEVPMMGSTFKWVGIYGYDSKAQKFTAVWADNGDDGNDLATGTHDATTNTFTFTGEREDPRHGGKSVFKWTIRLHLPGELTVEMYEPDEAGKEQLVMRIAGVKE